MPTTIHDAVMSSDFVFAREKSKLTDAFMNRRDRGINHIATEALHPDWLKAMIRAYNKNLARDERFMKSICDSCALYGDMDGQVDEHELFKNVDVNLSSLSSSKDIDQVKAADY